MNLPIMANGRAQRARTWPQILAYAAAALCAGASTSTNLLYGLAKGSDLSTSLVWGAVSVATSIIFLLAWPALIRALNERQWSQAVAMLVALLLSGAYSVTAALGSAAGGRTNATQQEQSVTDQRAKAQAAWESAKRELDTLAKATPGAELPKLIQAAQDELAGIQNTRPLAEIDARLRVIEKDPRRYGCAPINGSMNVFCPTLSPERARAVQRERLAAQIEKLTADLSSAGQRHAEAQARAQATMDKAAAELVTIKPGKPANSDAKALSRYLAALGIELDADRLNDLLTLLAVAMIEAGGGLALTVAMGLSAPERTDATGAASGVEASTTQFPGPRPAQRPQGAPRSGHERSLDVDTTAARRRDAPTGQDQSGRGQSAAVAGVQFLAFLWERGGAVSCGQRAMADALGWSKSWVHVVLHELAGRGLVHLDARSTGTEVRIARGAT